MPFIYSHFTCLLLCSYQRYDTSRVSTQLPGQSRFAKLIISYTLAKNLHYQHTTKALKPGGVSENELKGLIISTLPLLFIKKRSWNKPESQFYGAVQVSEDEFGGMINAAAALIIIYNNITYNHYLIINDYQVSEDEFGGMINAAAALPKKFGFDWWQASCTYHRLCCLKS